MFSESGTKADKENIILNIFDDRKKKKTVSFIDTSEKHWPTQIVLKNQTLKIWNQEFNLHFGNPWLAMLDYKVHQHIFFLMTKKTIHYMVFISKRHLRCIITMESHLFLFSKQGKAEKKDFNLLTQKHWKIFSLSLKKYMTCNILYMC